MSAAWLGWGLVRLLLGRASLVAGKIVVMLLDLSRPPAWGVLEAPPPVAVAAVASRCWWVWRVLFVSGLLVVDVAGGSVR